MGKKAMGPHVTAEPTAPQDIQELRAQLSGFLGATGTQTSPWYSQLSNQYQGLLSGGTALPSYIAPQIESMATTGEPWDMSRTYAAAYPTYQNELAQALGQAKESASTRGTLRSSPGIEQLGEAASGTTADFIKYLVGTAQQGYESAMGRKQAAIPQALQAAQYPTSQMGNLIQIAQALEGGQYPELASALNYATQGLGQTTYKYGMENFGQSANSGMSSCCWIFIEGEGELTQIVRCYRDEHFGKWSDVGLGYRWMARRLVPLMKRFAGIKSLVKGVMTTPLTEYAKYRYGENRYGFIFRPLASLWVSIWRLSGKMVSYRDSRSMVTV